MRRLPVLRTTFALLSVWGCQSIGAATVARWFRLQRFDFKIVDRQTPLNRRSARKSSCLRRIRLGRTAFRKPRSPLLLLTVE